MKKKLLSLVLLLSSFYVTAEPCQAEPRQEPTRASILQTDIVPYLETEQTSNQLQSVEDVLAVSVQPAAKTDVRVGSIALWESEYSITDSPILVGDAGNMSGVFLVQTNTANANFIGTIGVAKKSAAEIAAAVTTVEAATSAATPLTLAKRDSEADVYFRDVTVTHQDYATAQNNDFITKLCVDDEITGLSPKSAVKALADSNTAIAGVIVPLLVDGVDLYENDRVLLNGQTNKTQNGIWVVKSGSMTRPEDFNVGSEAQGAYVLTTTGTVYKGTGWFCGSAAIIGTTDEIEPFVQYSMPDQTSARNIGEGVGSYGIFKDKVGDTINFKGVAAGNRIIISGIGNGEAYSESVKLNSDLKLELSNGSVTQPALSFKNDPSLGMYRAAADQLAFAASGDQVMLVTTADTRINNMLYITDGKYLDLPIATDEVRTYSIWDKSATPNATVEFDYNAPQEIIVLANSTGGITINLTGSPADCDHIVTKNILVIRKAQTAFGTSTNGIKVVTGYTPSGTIYPSVMGKFLQAYWIPANGTTPAMSYPLYAQNTVYNRP